MQEKAGVQVLSRLVVLEGGMHVFRYASNAQPAPRILISLSPAPFGKGSVDFFPSEGVSRNVLAAPGDCVVARVKGEQASVLITEYKFEGETGTVQLRLDKIASSLEAHPSAAVGQEAPAVVSVPTAATSPSLPSLKMTLLGHIQERGDVSVQDDWLGDPAGLRRIEGFSVAPLDAPKDLVLAYSCRVAGSADPQIGVAGQFVGTRRQAKSITAVAFALTGPNAADFQLGGEVAFAGHPPLAITPNKELSGSTGTEQLVALRIQINPRSVQVSSPQSPWDDLARTQTFKKD